MIEIYRSNDMVRISYVMMLLREAECDPFLADEYTASVEGSISAIPRRILVPRDRLEEANSVLAQLDE